MVTKTNLTFLYQDNTTVQLYLEPRVAHLVKLRWYNKKVMSIKLKTLLWENYLIELLTQQTRFCDLKIWKFVKLKRSWSQCNGIKKTYLENVIKIKCLFLIIFLNYWLRTKQSANSYKVASLMRFCGLGGEICFKVSPEHLLSLVVRALRQSFIQQPTVFLS